MPVAPTYPGVYIEEVPSGVHTIAGVATSVAAFMDCFNRGRVNRPIHLLSLGDFERELGGLRFDSEASYAIQQFFQNGGTEAWVIRTEFADLTPNGLVAANALIGDAAAALALTVVAISPGTWGNRLRARIDAASATTFNLTISELAATSAAVVRQEVFRNVSMDPANLRFVESVVNDENTGSALVRVTRNSATLPLSNGVVTIVPPVLPVGATVAAGTFTVTIDGGTAITATVPPHAALADIEAVRATVEGAIRSADPANATLAGAAVTVETGDRLRIVPGLGTGALNSFVFAAVVADTTAADLGIVGAGGVANVGTYRVGYVGVTVDSQLTGSVAGENGLPPTAAELNGNPLNKTGIFALEDVDLFNILCIPCIAADGFPLGQADAVLAVAETYCEQRRAFLLVDTPFGFLRPIAIQNWLSTRGNLRHRNAGLFYPRVRVPDPLDEFRLRSFGPSGTMAGLMARIDANRGVWKASAGTEATLTNVQELEYVLSDAENGTLNPLAINSLRQFPIYGRVSWGARTLVGSDQGAPDWRYIPVRRLALYLEESLYRGTKWVVFEPNDEPLWAQIRLNIGAFMHDLFRQGAFQGSTPSQAYLVQCDQTTTTQNDINNGIVNIIVGFAPLKPAEFVIIHIQQLAGQIQT
jgi:phage tail sheath protein FI